MKEIRVAWREGENCRAESLEDALVWSLEALNGDGGNT